MRPRPGGNKPGGKSPTPGGRPSGMPPGKPGRGATSAGRIIIPRPGTPVVNQGELRMNRLKSIVDGLRAKDEIKKRAWQAIEALFRGYTTHTVADAAITAFERAMSAEQAQHSNWQDIAGTFRSSLISRVERHEGKN